jgi:superfamily II DNA/RNA helicase
MGVQPPKQLSEEETKTTVESFEALGICKQLAESAAALGWKTPTGIQQQAIPLALAGARPAAQPLHRRGSPTSELPCPPAG